jgi:hypothetical protein
MCDFRFVSRHLPLHSTATVAALPAMSLIPVRSTQISDLRSFHRTLHPCFSFASAASARSLAENPADFISWNISEEAHERTTKKLRQFRRCRTRL